jgi:TolB-like protein
MKKISLKAVFITLFFLLMGYASVTPAFAAVDKLDKAIRDVSDYINKRIPPKTKVVFLNIKSDWPDLSEYILSGLMENGVNDGVFSVIDRQQIDVIRQELNFQWSGEVSDKSAQQIGEMLGAQTIVSGTVAKIGSVYRIQARAIEVQTAAVQGQFSLNVDNKGLIVSLTKKVVPAAASPVIAVAKTGGASPQTPAAAPAAPAVPPPPPPPPVPEPPAYKIGDTGPAGGFIFYDKGNNSDGWRYLEAAPAAAEFQAVWQVRDWRRQEVSVEDTQETIGSGKRNTQLIVEKYKHTSGEWDTAAQKVVDLVFNKFDDWFLPSKAELDQMYGNLKRKNLGNFKDSNYWSSTQDNIVYVNSQNFKDGKMEQEYRTSRLYVRPIRQVPGPSR